MTPPPSKSRSNVNSNPASARQAAFGCFALVAQVSLWFSAWFFALFGFVEQPCVMHIFDNLMVLGCIALIYWIVRSSGVALG